MLSLPKYGDKAASMRQRFQQFIPAMDGSDISVEVRPLLKNGYIARVNAGLGISMPQVALSYISRFFVLLSVRRYDVVWLHYEAFPFLPSFFESLLLASGRPVILDFDDAIFHQYDNHRSVIVRQLLGNKLQKLMAGAVICSAGNAYLADYARRFCSDVRVLPTVVDTNMYKPDLICEVDAVVTVGWIGTPSTWNYVKPLVPMLQKLCETHNVSVKIIGAGVQKNPPSGLTFVGWTEDTEIADIQSMDIGIMPLPDEPWARGKCGYKLIQYMACGLPVVASPVGVNSAIVDQGVNGYLAESVEEFSNYIKQLLADASLRSKMGVAGRQRVESDYSLKTHAPRFVQIIKDAAASKCVE